MDKILLTIVAMGMAFLLWQMQEEIKNQQNILADISRKTDTCHGQSPPRRPLPQPRPMIVK